MKQNSDLVPKLILTGLLLFAPILGASAKDYIIKKINNHTANLTVQPGFSFYEFTDDIGLCPQQSIKFTKYIAGLDKNSSESRYNTDYEGLLHAVELLGGNVTDQQKANASKWNNIPLSYLLEGDKIYISVSEDIGENIKKQLENYLSEFDVADGDEDRSISVENIDVYQLEQIFEMYNASLIQHHKDIIRGNNGKEGLVNSKDFSKLETFSISSLEDSFRNFYDVDSLSTQEFLTSLYSFVFYNSEGIFNADSYGLAKFNTKILCDLGFEQKNSLESLLDNTYDLAFKDKIETKNAFDSFENSLLIGVESLKTAREKADSSKSIQDYTGINTSIELYGNLIKNIENIIEDVTNNDGELIMNRSGSTDLETTSLLNSKSLNNWNFVNAEFEDFVEKFNEVKHIYNQIKKLETPQEKFNKWDVDVYSGILKTNPSSMLPQNQDFENEEFSGPFVGTKIVFPFLNFKTTENNSIGIGFSGEISDLATVERNVESGNINLPIPLYGATKRNEVFSVKVDPEYDFSTGGFVRFDFDNAFSFDLNAAYHKAKYTEIDKGGNIIYYDDNNNELFRQPRPMANDDSKVTDGFSTGLSVNLDYGIVQLGGSVYVMPLEKDLPYQGEVHAGLRMGHIYTSVDRLVKQVKNLLD